MNLAEILKIFRFNIKEYIPEILGLFLTGLFTNYLLNLIYSPLHIFLLSFFKRDYDIFPLSFSIFRILFWIIFYLSLRMLWTEIVTFYTRFFPAVYGFNYIDNRSRSNKRKSPLTPQKFLQDFIFQGNIKPINDGLMITNSPAGCLIKPVPFLLNLGRKWKNFQAELEIEFPKQKQEGFNDFIGIVFRAQNFDDYFMLEVCRINNDLIIRPHVRVNVNWDAPYLNPDFNMLSNFFKSQRENVILSIKAKGNEVSVVEAATNGELKWYLPSHVEANLLQAVGGNQSRTDLSKTYVGEIYFRNKTGMFGFRNYGNELAFIKSLHIRGI